MLQKENKNINSKFLNLFFDKKSFVCCALLKISNYITYNILLYKKLQPTVFIKNKIQIKNNIKLLRDNKRKISKENTSVEFVKAITY